METATMTAVQLARFDQAVAAWREACHAFAYMTGTGAQMFAAEAAMRDAGRDDVAGLVTVPVAAVKFSDVRADGVRMRAVCGSLTWSGRALPCGVESRSYGPADVVQVKAR
jgi:hypothetical protein